MDGGPVTIAAAGKPSSSAFIPGGSAPVIAGNVSLEGKEGQNYTYQISASNSPSSYSVKGKLPKGLKVDQAKGIISGTLGPGSAGSYELTLKAYNGNGTGTKDLTITVK